MKHTDQGDEGNKEAYSNSDELDFLWKLLVMPKLPDDMQFLEQNRDNEPLQKIAKYLFDLRELTSALSKGDLDKLVYSKGYLLSNLKALQSNLRHMTWQTKKIAEGDFSQKVDFLGEFSESFNEMAEKLNTYNERMTFQANFDQLTQLPNRHFLMPFLSKCFERFLRDHEDFCIMLLDIDHFKKVNDTYGHDAGDMVLMQLGELLSTTFRSSDLLARYGGEEFLAVLINTRIKEAKIIAERARKVVQDATINLPDGLSIRVSVSIGVSQTKNDDLDFESIVKRSDDALYIAKANGRNQVVIL